MRPPSWSHIISHKMNPFQPRITRFVPESQGHVLGSLNYTKISGPLCGGDLSLAVFLNQINCKISKIVRLSQLKLLDLLRNN